jgi:hypothetical protein
VGNLFFEVQFMHEATTSLPVLLSEIAKSDAAACLGLDLLKGYETINIDRLGGQKCLSITLIWADPSDLPDRIRFRSPLV